MSRILLVHWNRPEAETRAERLRGAGHRVTIHADPESQAFRKLRDRPPEAVVIDLRRLPAQGRALGVWLRQTLATRKVPLVFIEGDPEKTDRVRSAMPDAVFTPWSRVRGAVTHALRTPAASPVVPGTMDGYAGTPLPKKLGIKEGTRLALLGAPDGFDAVLGPLPGGVVIRRRARGESDVILLFAGSVADLERRFPGAVRILADGGRLWITWPKKASGVRTDITAARVRGHGLGNGLVDFKIGAIDATWSGLCFARRPKRS